jgi:cytochrome c
MRNQKTWLATLGLLATISLGAQAQDNAAAAGAAGQLGCMMCHNAEVKVVGPAFKAVAEKYKDQADAADKLFNKVKNGGAGVWGRVPMPAHNQVPDEKIHQMVAWVLRGAPAR